MGVRGVAVGFLLVLAVLGLFAGPAQAAPNSFTVDSLGDAPDANTSDNVCRTALNACTLRAAIQQANATPNVDGPDEIGFGIPGTVTLTSALPELSTSMNITGTTAGAGSAVRRSFDSGVSNFRIINITGGSTTVGIQNLTVSNGFAEGEAFPANAGGGIFNDGGTLNITNSTISANTADWSGGGIFNVAGVVNIVNSTVGINVADSFGGGIANNRGTLNITGSTFQTNRTDFSGGAIYNSFGFAGTSIVGSVLTIADSAFGGNISSGNGGAITNEDSRATITNATFSGNSAGSSSIGGAIYNFSGPVSATNATVAGNSAGSAGGIYNNSSTTGGTTLKNTLVARNTATNGGSPDLGGVAFTSSGNNLIGDASGSQGFTDGTNGDRAGSNTNPIDPTLKLAGDGKPDLTDNGGPTRTVALLPGSPAIDAGNDSVTGAPTNLTTDQRGAGFGRKRGAHVDIGAFEVQNQPPVAQDLELTTQEGEAAQITLAATDPDNDSLTYRVVQGPSHGSLSSMGANLTYAAEANYTGSDSFTYRANDGAADSNTATVTIVVNDAPTISDISDKTIERNTSTGEIPFTVDDAGTAAKDLTVTGSSDNTALVPSSNIVFGPANPTDGDRTVRVTPAGGRTGTATITVRVSDGSAHTAGTFVLTVRDTIAPSVPTITAPAQGSYSRDGTFAVRGTAEKGATVRLFEGATLKGQATANARGLWSMALGGQAEGRHAYRARATDDAGNTSMSSPVRVVTVDKTKPKVTGTKPASNATGVVAGSTVGASFSEGMDGATLNKTTFKLVKKGTSRPVVAVVSYKAAEKKAVLDPRTNLQPGATYTATITTGARDLAGNPLVQKTWSFTVR